MIVLRSFLRLDLHTEDSGMTPEQDANPLAYMILIVGGIVIWLASVMGLVHTIFLPYFWER